MTINALAFDVVVVRAGSLVSGRARCDRISRCVDRDERSLATTPRMRVLDINPVYSIIFMPKTTTNSLPLDVVIITAGRQAGQTRQV